MRILYHDQEKFESHAKKDFLTRPIGEGVYSQVWKVKNSFKGKSVLKINVKYGSTPGFDNIRELDILLKVRCHPYFCKINGIVNAKFDEVLDGMSSDKESDSIHFLLKQETCSIASILERSDSHNYKKFSFQLALAIGFLHVNGIVHGDIKPDNILYDLARDSVVLADFGHSLYKDHFYVQTVKILYTDGYRAPEFDRYTVLSASGDVYAYGCVVYELMTGHQAIASNFGGLEKCRDLAGIVRACTKRRKESRPSIVEVIHDKTFDCFPYPTTVYRLPEKKIFRNYNFNAEERDTIMFIARKKRFSMRVIYHALSVVVHMMNVRRGLHLERLLETCVCIFVKLFATFDSHYHLVKQIDVDLFDVQLELDIIEEFACCGVYFDCLYGKISVTACDVIELIFERWVMFESDKRYTDLDKFYTAVLEYQGW